MLPAVVLLTLQACLASAASRSELIARAFNPETDLDLGAFGDFDAFYEALGTNASDWTYYEEPVIMETVDIEAAEEWNRLWHEGKNPENHIFARQKEICRDRSGWEWLVCENMPESGVLWAVGVPLAVFFGPRVVHWWLLDIADLVRSIAGALRRQNSPSRRSLPLRARDGTILARDADVIRFKIEMPTKQLEARDENMSVSDAKVFEDYIYDAASGEVHSKGISGSISGEPNEFDASALHSSHPARQSNGGWTLAIEWTRTSSETTTLAQSWCIAEVLENMVQRAAKYHTESCQPLHNRGTWRGNIGISFFYGRWSQNTPRHCC
ncbi:hypothetical protein F5X68DRAFT_188479 [Plectosphaerella plurivora]|uniref:Uncharacterized protein n=1 Tax=Plectosphaerella plurivora TaxID=936078 RepID=A0A9P9AEC1_9PEZI|nr:hypothetical protein F5X68DRAFT_188479 [Plectosphaerella plurivora]